VMDRARAGVDVGSCCRMRDGRQTDLVGRTELLPGVAGAGVRLFEYQPRSCMPELSVDGVWSVVGSPNMDALQGAQQENVLAIQDRRFGPSSIGFSGGPGYSWEVGSSRGGGAASGPRAQRLFVIFASSSSGSRDVSPGVGHAVLDWRPSFVERGGISWSPRRRRSWRPAPAVRSRVYATLGTRALNVTACERTANREGLEPVDMVAPARQCSAEQGDSAGKRHSHQRASPVSRSVESAPMPRGGRQLPRLLSRAADKTLELRSILNLRSRNGPHRRPLGLSAESSASATWLFRQAAQQAGAWEADAWAPVEHGPPPRPGDVRRHSGRPESCPEAKPIAFLAPRGPSGPLGEKPSPQQSSEDAPAPLQLLRNGRQDLFQLLKIDRLS
jgi:hypothetical protein